MLIDVIKHQKENKALWIIVIVFVNSLGAVIYYFVAKRPRDKLEKQEQQMVQPAQIPVQSTESSSVESVVSNQAPEVVSTQPTSLQRPPQNTPSI
jgi:hypothetical protein